MMKKLWLIIFLLIAWCAFVWSCRAQQSTMGLRNAGAIAAFPFIQQQGIVDPTTQNDLAGFCSELQKVGIGTVNGDLSKTNLVDAMFLQPRFLPNGTNGAKGWTGASITTSNIVFSPWAASFGANALISMPIADSRTNTLVIVWHGYASNYNNAFQQVLGGVFNSNPANDSAQWVYMDNVQQKFTFRETNTFFNGPTLSANSLFVPLFEANYSFDKVQFCFSQRTVTGTTCNGIGGGGIYSFYDDGVQCKFGNAVTNFYVTNTAIVPNNALNMLLLGVDTKGPAGGYFGGYFRGEIAWAGVFNQPVDTNMMAGIYRALRWLEPETENYVFWGDSQFIMSPIGGLPNTAGNGACTPAFQMWTGANTNKMCWKNYSQSGVRWANMYNAATSNRMYLDAPYGKVTKTYHYIQGGINDIYGDGSSLNTISNSLFAIVTMDNNLGIRPYVYTVMPVATNTSSIYTYTPASEVIVDGLNLMIITNGFRFAGVVRLDLLQGQTDLDPNLNTFSADGLHLFGATGYVMQRRIADLALGLEFAPVGNMLTLGNYPYTLKIGDYLCRVTTAAGSVTLTLPAVSQDAEVHIVKKISSDANVITVSGNGKNIDGAASTTISVLNASKTFQYDQSTGTWNVN